MTLPPGASETKAQTKRHGLWRTVLFGFVERAEKEYGGLDEFYVAHENEYPLLAGLTYVDANYM